MGVVWAREIRHGVTAKASHHRIEVAGRPGLVVGGLQGSDRGHFRSNGHQRRAPRAGRSSTGTPSASSSAVKVAITSSTSASGR
jgi:hypothetical protein